MTALDLSLVKRLRSGSGIVELELGREFVRGAELVPIYPGAARNACLSGWAGPRWWWRIECDADAVELRQLRSWYGPPGMLPPASYYASHRVQLAGRHRVELRACLLDANGLRPENLEPKHLDPEGLDGYEGPPQRFAAVLMADLDGATLEARRSQGPGFLRPGLLAFLPPATRTTITITYEQGRAPGFEPGHEIRLVSNTVELGEIRTR